MGYLISIDCIELIGCLAIVSTQAFGVSSWSFNVQTINIEVFDKKKNIGLSFKWNNCIFLDFVNIMQISI